MSMTFKKFSEINLIRCKKGFNHSLSDWSASDWMVATLGELGEAANVLKKLNRERDGIKGNNETLEELKVKLALELGDTFIYFDLMLQALGIDIEKTITDSFNKKSKQIGSSVLID